MTDPLSGTRWKRPTIREIADLAGVGTASVDRVLNNRPGVKANTRNAVQAAIAFRKSIDQACNPVAAATEAEVPMAAEAAKPSIKLVEP